MRKKYPMNRKNWILSMYDFGEQGKQDFNDKHKTIIPASKKLVHKTKWGMRLKRLPNKYDVEQYDMPRNDIVAIELKNGQIIRVGSDTIQKNLEYFKKYALPYINRSFTSDELKNLELYIEYPSKNLKNHFAGTSEEWRSNKNEKFSVIDIGSKKDGPTVVHEVLHALKFKKGHVLKSVSKDEAETELETLMRISPKDRLKIPCADGYYSLVKGNRCKARDEDVKIIDQHCDLRKNKKDITACIKRNLNKTSIGKIKVPKKLILKARKKG